MRQRRSVILLIVAALITLILAFNVASISAGDNTYILGLVFIDDNMNGVWDAGEQGYGGDLQWDADADAWRYVGATVTLTAPSYEEFNFETAGYSVLAGGKADPCSQQDILVDGEPNPNPVRPCAGTWGMPNVENDTRMVVYLHPPAGYTVTSEDPQIFTTGTDTAPVDFGIAPTG